MFSIINLSQTVILMALSASNGLGVTTPGVTTHRLGTPIMSDLSERFRACVVHDLRSGREPVGVTTPTDWEPYLETVLDQRRRFCRS